MIGIGKLVSSGSRLIVGDHMVELEYPIQEAFALEDKILVLYSPDAYQRDFGQFPNFVAFTPSGTKLWTAELPTTMTGDRYYEVSSWAPLVARSVYSFECELESSSGRIISKRFLK